MEILSIILIGALVGFLGSLVAGRKVHWLLTIVLGIVGNALGFYVWRGIGGDSVIIGYVFGVAAAALLIIVFTSLAGRRR